MKLQQFTIRNKHKPCLNEGILNFKEGGTSSKAFQNVDVAWTKQS